MILKHILLYVPKGSLYREGLISPGGLITSSVAEEDVNTSRIQAEATKKSTAAIKKPSVLPSERYVYIGAYFYVYIC
jgi:hypothetical protein